MKFLLGLLLGVFCVSGQTDPCDGDCGTNGWSEVGPPVVGSLLIRVDSIKRLNGDVIYQGSQWVGSNGFLVAGDWTLQLTNVEGDWVTTVAVTNSQVGEYYTIREGSIPGFSDAGQFAGTNGEYLSTYTNQGPFWGVKNLSYIYSALSITSGSNYCAGNYVATANYSTGWDTNGASVVRVSDGTGRADTKIYALGSFSDDYCGTGSISITNPPSPSYTFSVFLPSGSGPSPYPLRLNNFLP